jgi:hypothetical protein
MNIKYKMNSKIKAFGLMVAMLLSYLSADAQCSITTNGAPPCVGQPIQFFCNTVGASNYSWDFNGQGSNTTTCNPTFTFNTAGTKTIKLTLKLANGNTCNATFTFTIKESPVIDVVQLNNDTSCFFGNSFCFKDQTKPINDPGGSNCIKCIKYLFSDGELIKICGTPPSGVALPNTFCKSFKDPAGGTYDLLVEVEDCNGCITRKNYPNFCTVRASMGLSFTSPRPQACDSVKLTVTNNSAISLADIDRFTWDWGDGSAPNTTSWKPTASHTFYVQGPNAGDFNTKLTVWDKFGCKESFTFFSSATNIKLNPKILADFDSVCIKTPTINFSIKGGSIAKAISPTFNYGDPPTGPLNITRQWVGSHKFSGLGPYKVKFTYSHPICGNREIYDTILVLGPSSAMEKPNNRIQDFEKFQCVITDSVHFPNNSVFYHNDKTFYNDDSTWMVYDSLKYDFVRDTLVNPNEPFDKNFMRWIKNTGGFNYPYIHLFKTPTGQVTRDAAFGADGLKKRGNECVIRVWDFDDDFCEKCTTDTKKGINTVLKNCKYSKDSLPVHWYTPWDSIYQTRFSTRAQNGTKYNSDSGLCVQIKIWPSNQMAIIRDTIIYYGDNPLATKAKDSVIFKNWKAQRVKVPAFLTGPARFDASTETPRFYLRRSDTAFIDNNNGFPPNRIIGYRYQTLQLGQSLILNSKHDTARFNYWIVYVQDTIASNLLQPWHKVWALEPMQGFKVGDSINAAYHRQKFYEGTTVRCFNPRLWQKDICHPMACELEDIVSLALVPPSAKKLRKEGVQCLGGSQDNYGITFILSDTKPGCTQTFAQINFDTALDPNGWVNAVGANLTSGSIATGNLPPVNPPYNVPPLGYQIMGSPGTRFSKQFTVDDIKDSITGYINVGLIIGNGMWPPDGDAYPSSCIDTVYYNKFARFPILDNKFRIIKPKQGLEFTNICRKDTLCLALMPRNRSYIPDVEELNWSLSAANVGKYYDKYYTLQVNESYQRFQKDPNDPSHLFDYLYHKQTSYFDGKYATIDSQYIKIAEVTKWHTEADITPVFDIIKQILLANNIDVYELSPAQISEIIWNGQGTFQKPYTGSRGCLDTTGFGRFIRFYKVADKKNILHFRDTSIQPIKTVKGYDGQTYNAYCFVPQYSGFFIANFGLRSRAPENCTMQSGTAKRVIVGFYGLLNYSDTIICHGDKVQACPQFNYFHAYPDICNCLLDPTDYWGDRISQSGQPNREAKTKWDLSKADDNISLPATIFGPFPYGQTGIGSGSPRCVQLGGLTVPGTVYYLSDTGGYYQVRTAAGDSTGCRDTFPQDIYVTAAKAYFNLGQTRPECKTIVEFFDSSSVYDPCKWKLYDVCDYIVKWRINWGDSSRSAKNVFFGSLPPNIAHDFTRNGTFEVTLIVDTYLGCTDTFKLKIYIPGPVPLFDTFIPRKYCVGEKAIFSNLSKYALADSSIWTWDFGDNVYDNQYDTIIKSGVAKNDTITHAYTKAGRYYVFLQQAFQLRMPDGSVKICSVMWPDTTGGQMKPFYVDIFQYDTVKLMPKDTSVCLNQPVLLTGNVIPYAKYTRYKWNLGLSATDTIILSDTFRSVSYSAPGVYTVKFMGDKNSVITQNGKVCPAQDSMKITVALVKADFDIDTSASPVFCFENKSTNSVNHNWSFYNQDDIMAITPASARAFDIQLGFASDPTGANAAKPCRDFRDSQGAYWVCLEAVNSIGCRDTICKRLVNRFEASIRPPNVFTPAGGNNDVFTGLDREGLTGNNVFNIEIKGEEKYDLVIFDRWGVKVFSSTDAKTDWNGQVNNTGANCPDGTYFYLLKYRYKGKDKDEPVLNGTVQIIR